MSNDDEAMEVDTQESSSDNHQQALGVSSHLDNKEESLVTVSVKWLNSDPPQKPHKCIEKCLQTWLNNGKHGSCKAVKPLEYDRFAIEIEPAPAQQVLLKLNGETLTSKDGSTFRITSVNGMAPQQKTQTSEAASVDVQPSSKSEPQDDEMDEFKKHVSGEGAADSTIEDLTYVLPVPCFLYMSNVYKEQLKHIEKMNGVKITTEVKVTFSSGDQHNALAEFKKLYQKCTNECLNEFRFTDVLIQNDHSEASSNTKKIIQKSDNKDLVTASSDETIICGPSKSHEAIIESMKATQIVNSSVGESAGTDEDMPLKIEVNINDPLVTEGLTVDEEQWKLITASYDRYLDGIMSKFGVYFNVSQSDDCKDKVVVKVRYRRPGGNASMESHAARALLRLCQKIQTVPITLTHLQGASGFSGPPQNRSHGSKPEGSSTDPVFNGQLVSVKDKDEAAGDDEDEKCCICLDAFTDKRRLKCKHEFCSECLNKSEKSLGPFCPVCKDVFGVMTGNQPDGQMTLTKHSLSLPGFHDCGMIEINYNIPCGTQTDKHPNPGQFYHGINRRAYLPDNKEGNEVLRLLKRAFDQGLIFTVGSSRTTGRDNQVTWNDIHHKTSTLGGPQCFGYPDPDYLSRVKEELKAKGIK